MREKCKICDKEFNTKKGLGYHLSMKHNVKTAEYIEEHYSVPKSVIDWRSFNIEDAVYANNLLKQYHQFDNYLDLFQYLYDQYSDLRKLDEAMNYGVGKLCMCLGVKTNRDLSEEHKEKISKKHTGKKLSKDHKKNIGIGLYNQENKEERYKKLSEKLKGRRHTRESIEKMIKNRKPSKHDFRGISGIRADLGHNCRSTWEANYARVLKLEQVDYQFEPQIFWLKRADGSETSYTPDFYLPDKNLYIEVKGYWKDDAIEKFILFLEQYPELEIEVIEAKEYNKMKKEYKDKIKEWE